MGLSGDTLIMVNKNYLYYTYIKPLDSAVTHGMIILKHCSDFYCCL